MQKHKVLTQVPDATGHFGPYGGMFVPETLMAPLHELTVEYEKAKIDPAFKSELKYLLEEYLGTYIVPVMVWDRFKKYIQENTIS